MEKTALLVIDMQNDFVEKNAIIEVPGIRPNLAKFQEFIDKMRAKGVLVIYTRHIYSPDLNPIEAKLFPELSKEGLRENSRGSQIVNQLKPNQDDIVIAKRRYDAFIGTDLEIILRNNNIENIIITGTMSNICCESTARSAMMKDFNVYFCSDLNFTFTKKAHQATLRNIKSNFGWVKHSKEIYKIIYNK